MGDILGDDRPLDDHNQGPPSQALSPLWMTMSILQSYGWFILFGLIFVYVIWKRVEPKYRRWEQKRRETEEFLNTDPAVLEQRQMALLASRERMQEKYQEQSNVAAKEREEREAMKRQEKIDSWDKMSGWGPGQSLANNNTSSGAKPPPKKSQLRKDNYNPMMGHGGGGGYRPSRRYPSGGG